MNNLTQLRNNLLAAEYEYRTAQGSLDSSPLQVILAKEALKQARFVYNEACREHIEELYFCEGEA